MKKDQKQTKISAYFNASPNGNNSATPPPTSITTNAESNSSDTASSVVVNTERSMGPASARLLSIWGKKDKPYRTASEESVSESNNTNISMAVTTESAVDSRGKNKSSASARVRFEKNKWSKRSKSSASVTAITYKKRQASSCSSELKSMKKDKLRSQIEYYLSDTNLETDDFYHEKIRNSTKGNGWIRVSDIMTAHRIVAMNITVVDIIEALKDSTEVEILDDIEDNGIAYGKENRVWIRRREGRALPKLAKPSGRRYGGGRHGKRRKCHDYDDDQWGGGCEGFTSRECNDLMANGVKPWEDDAGAVLGALYGDYM